MDASEPNRPAPPDETGPDPRAERPGQPVPARAEDSTWRRHVANSGWVCAVVTAVAVGAWSFHNAGPDAGYAKHDPLDESAVRHELESGRHPGAPESPGTAAPSGEPSTATPSRSAGTSPSAPSRGARTFPLKVARGAATVTVQCRGDGRVRLLGLSPAEGYTADDVVYGPAAYATFELEPPDDDGDETGESDAADDDHETAGPAEFVVKVRCAHGRPAASVVEDD